MTSMWPQVLVNGIVTGTGYGLVALSFGLIYSSARFFDLAHAGVYTASAYCAFLLVDHWSVSLPLAGAIAVVFAALLGTILDTCFYRPMRRRGTNPLILLIASLGLLIVLQNAIGLAFGDAIQSFRMSEVSLGYGLFGARVTSIQLLRIGVAILLAVGVTLWLKLSRSGMLLRAVADDPLLGSVWGLPVDQVITQAFILGSAITAVAAILAGCDTDLTPMMGFQTLVMGVVSLIVGGTRPNVTALLGGLFVGLVQQIGILFLPGQWTDLVLYSVLALVIVISRGRLSTKHGPRIG